MLKGKRAFITGGSSGIGKGIALNFARAGASVVIFGTNQEKGERALQELNGVKTHSDQTFHFFTCDVSCYSDVSIKFAKAIEILKGIDILVNNAGITRDNLLMKMSEEDWDRVLDVNLKSAFNTCKLVIRSMMKAKNGKVINIASVIGLTGNPGQVNYSASKSGMIGLTQSLAKEVASRGICVNCVAPGFIETPMTDALSDAQKEAIMQKIPMQKLGQVEDIANVCLFLASPLSNYITGEVIAVDGGMTA